jgi:hypothetical protein
MRFPMPDPKSNPLQELRTQLESIFIQLHHVYDGTNVCQIALDNQRADADTEVATTLRIFILAKLDKQLIYFSRLIAGMGGTTDYHEGTDYAEGKEDDDEG